MVCLDSTHVPVLYFPEELFRFLQCHLSRLAVGGGERAVLAGWTNERSLSKLCHNVGQDPRGFQMERCKVVGCRRPVPETSSLRKEKHSYVIIA
jgi:hypothetical protein